jgi:hypothetical protein
LEHLYSIILVMADIRKRKGAKGITYQLRYPSKATKSGYAYKRFLTKKQARKFHESGEAKRNGAARFGGGIVQSAAGSRNGWRSARKKDATGATLSRTSR